MVQAVNVQKVGHGIIKPCYNLKKPYNYSDITNNVPLCPGHIKMCGNMPWFI